MTASKPTATIWHWNAYYSQGGIAVTGQNHDVLHFCTIQNVNLRDIAVLCQAVIHVHQKLNTSERRTGKTIGPARGTHRRKDTVPIRKGALARDNAQLVEKGAGIIESLSGTITTPDEARAIPGLC